MVEDRMNQFAALCIRIGRSVVFLLLLPLYVVGLLLSVILYLHMRLLELLFSFTNHGKARFFPLVIYPWTSMLQDNWLKIRRELDRQLTNLEEIPNYQDLAPSQLYLTQDDKWKTLVLTLD